MKNVLSLPSALAVLALFSPSSAHTWLENIRLIATNGTFIGPVGYPRGYVARGASPGPDQASVYMVQGNKQVNICGPTQKQPGNQAQGFPALQAAAGDNVALRYLENGHVTVLETGRPARGGMVFVYGTKEPKASDSYGEIHRVWNAEGTGGDKRGRLLATRPYDDGQCYQENGRDISKERQTKFPKAEAGGGDLVCQTDIQIPADAGADGAYTLYWVWEWPTLDVATGKLAVPQSYTACADIKLVSKSAATADSVAGTKFMDGQKGNTHAIKEQMQNQFLLDPSAQPALTTAPSFTLPSSNTPQQPTPSNQPPEQGSTRTASPTAPSVSPRPSSPPGGNNGVVTVTVTASAKETVTVTDYIIVKPDATTVPKGTATAIPTLSTSIITSRSTRDGPSTSAVAPSVTTVDPTGPPNTIRPFLPTQTPGRSGSPPVVYGRWFRGHI